MSKSLRVRVQHFVLALICLASHTALATQIEALQAAVGTPTVATNIPLISKIEIINIYHCPDCYDVRVTGFDNTTSITVDLRTARDEQDALSVKIVDVKRAN